MRYSVIKKFSGTNIIKIFERIKKDTGGNAVLLGYEEKDINGVKYYEVVIGIPSPEYLEGSSTSSRSSGKEHSLSKSSYFVEESQKAYSESFSRYEEEKSKLEKEQKNEVVKKDLDLHSTDDKEGGNKISGHGEFGTSLRNIHSPESVNIIYSFSDILSQIEEIKRELYGIKEQFRFLSQRNLTSSEIRLPPSYLFMFKRLVARGVERNLALSLTEDMIESGMPADEKSLSFVIKKYLSFANPLSDVLRGEKRKFLALVGPTGVGKTTTAAKISALYLMQGGKNICLLGTDRYRIGSVEQLKKYAEIMGVPSFFASTPEEIREIMPKLKHFDFIVIDTMGKSQYDIKNIRKISQILGEMKRMSEEGGKKGENIKNFSVEVCLLISCSQREDEIINVIKGFSEIDVDYIIFTKIDETSYPGVILNIGAFMERPVAFITTGQSVPDDIIDGNEMSISKFLFGMPPYSKYAFR